MVFYHPNRKLTDTKVFQSNKESGLKTTLIPGSGQAKGRLVLASPMYPVAFRIPTHLKYNL